MTNRPSSGRECIYAQHAKQRLGNGWGMLTLGSHKRAMQAADAIRLDFLEQVDGTAERVTETDGKNTGNGNPQT